MVLKLLHEKLARLDPAHDNYASAFVEQVLAAAGEVGASDLHLQPQAEKLSVRVRLDGVLQTIGDFPRGKQTDIVTRLKVLANLLTYRTDIPQEGRLAGTGANADLRVCTFPTLFGERAVVRFFARQQQYLYPQDLGLNEPTTEKLLHWLAETAGIILVTGPAGAGKSTTTYAALRHIARAAAGSRSLVSLEDPVEVVVPEVAQSQTNPAVGFDLASGLRTVLRQDPEVILIGEIRDAATCEVAFQAALTGHLILSTFHAGGVTEGVGRLLDMGLEPYVLRSGLRGLLSQRLCRRLCHCARISKDEAELCGLAIASAHVAAGCDECHQTCYAGRCLVAESLPALTDELGQAVLTRRDVPELQRLAVARGMKTLADEGLAHVAAGRISPLEFRRVFGMLATT